MKKLSPVERFFVFVVMLACALVMALIKPLAIFALIPLAVAVWQAYKLLNPKTSDD